MFRHLTAPAMLLSATLLATAQSAPHHGPLLLVANQKDHTLSLIDPAKNQQIAAVDVGGITGHEVIASPDGKLAFVPIYGSAGVGKPGTDGQSIAVIDLNTQKIIHTIDFPHGVRPHLPRFDPSGRTLYVTTELDHSLTTINPKTFAITGSVPTGEPESHMFVLTSDGRRAYTANVGPGNVSVIDLKTKKVITTIPISTTTQRISITPDNKYVFTSDQTQPRLAVIDTATNTVKSWITLPSVGYGSAVTNNGKWLLVTLKNHQVGVIDLSTMQMAKTLTVPGNPTEILVRPDDKVAYVSCGKQVAVIDIPTWTVPTTIEAGTGADGLAWAR
jgi:YVTN family beta-propeller protein